MRDLTARKSACNWSRPTPEVSARIIREAALAGNLFYRATKRFRQLRTISKPHYQIRPAFADAQIGCELSAKAGTSTGWLMKAHFKPSAVACNAKRWHARPTSIQCILSFRSETNTATPAELRI